MKPEEVESWMVLIPEGSIRLRDDRKKEQWVVEIRTFMLSKFPVTQELYSSVTADNPSDFVGSRNPVERVSWYDAVQFCNALSKVCGLYECYMIDLDSEIVEFIESANGYRLPTDAEWEYACRADTKAVQYGPINEIAWYEENSGASTHDVGLKAENGFGLFDMLGNVWEWCWDVYDPEVYGPYRVFRGGGWCDPERGCLASNRRRSHPNYRIDDLGFRVARSVQQNST
ncbi:formylglycine-generating enzyme family protein [Microbulbifer halophilus]|uniref:Formylglycine-generating enzyme family protein n=1 Tax=Microbulbifer halophilus TaxID=453963 RepID=A0ABW5EJE5_9GAMM|nr:formylglycine-generating enzyme family protein [Microbulbifer halophilus]MCW8128387.1 formylglycine-generating enzyme family protein [Microbulbifer halophilus]